MYALRFNAVGAIKDPSQAEFYARLKIDGVAEDGGALSFSLLNASHLPIVYTEENVKENPITLPPYVDLSFLLQPMQVPCLLSSN